MEVKTEPHDKVSVVSIIGSLDSLTSQTLVSHLADQIKLGNARLVVDLSQMDFTSSAGLRALLGGLKDCRSKGGDLRLASVQANVKKVMELSGFTSILKFFPTVDDAVKSYV